VSEPIALAFRDQRAVEGVVRQNHRGSNTCLSFIDLGVRF
jgi:hypothetical protein